MARIPFSSFSRRPSDRRFPSPADGEAIKDGPSQRQLRYIGWNPEKPEGVCSGKGRTGKETIVTEIPGNQGTPENPIGGSAPQQYQPVASGFQPVSAQPPAPPAKSGGGAMKIILIILGIFAFLILLVVCGLAYACHRVKQAFHTDSKTGETSMSIPGMSMSADSGMKFTSSELGVDLYPGADAAKSGNMRMNIAGNSVVTATFTTPDNKDQVIQFYKEKLGSDSTSMEFGDSAILTAKKSEHETISVTVTEGANQAAGKTQFVIQHTTVTKTN